MNKSSQDKYEEYAGVVEDFRTHGKGLKDVICRVRRIVGDSGMDSAASEKIDDVDTRFSAVQNEISELINSLPSSAMVREESLRGPPVIVRCKQWDDYKLQALNADTVSFLYRAEEKAFQVDALKEGRVYTYSGQMPNDITFLKAWLSRELCVEENRVLEGILAIG